MTNFTEIVEQHQKVISSLEALFPVMTTLGEEIVRCLKNKGKIIFMGNGGSAADAQHLAAEFVGRFQLERQAYSALALSTDTSILTAVANDYGFEHVFSRQLEALCSPGDIVIGITTSGKSSNIIRGMEKAHELRCLTAAFTGVSTGNLVQQIVQYCLTVDSSVTARIQEAHILIGHALCEWVENKLQADADV